MQPYSASHRKNFYATCKCGGCKPRRKKLHGGTDPIRRALKKSARQEAKRFIARTN